MITHAKVTQSTEEHRLIKVRFERESPEETAPTIEAVYRLEYPLEFVKENSIPVLLLLSITRTDTREPVLLNPEEAEQVHQAAMMKVSEAAEGW